MRLKSFPNSAFYFNTEEEKTESLRTLQRKEP